MIICNINKVYVNFLKDQKARNSRGSVMTKNKKLYTYGEEFAYKREYNNYYYIWILQKLGFNQYQIRFICTYFKKFDVVVLDKTAKGGYFMSMTSSCHINRFRRFLENNKVEHYVHIPTEIKYKCYWEDEENYNCPNCSPLLI